MTRTNRASESPRTDLGWPTSGVAHIWADATSPRQPPNLPAPHRPTPPPPRTHLEGAHERVIDAHHRARVLKLAAVIGGAEDGHELALGEELVALLDHLLVARAGARRGRKAGLRGAVNGGPVGARRPAGRRPRRSCQPRPGAGRFARASAPLRGASPANGLTAIARRNARVSLAACLCLSGTGLRQGRPPRT
jgi:hypothetical protein